MQAHSLTTRSANFAFLFGPPRTLGRQEAARVYDRVCDKLKIDDFAFQYQSAKDSVKSQGFRIHLERREGRGLLGITLENPNVHLPMRLSLDYVWPPTLEHVYDQFDLAATAVFDALEGNWQRVRAEARLRAHCTVHSRSALAFLREEFLKVPAGWLDSLGQPLTFINCKFVTAAAGPIEGPLDGPGRELSIEVLREDPACIYFDLLSTWSPIAAPDAASEPRPAAVRAIDQAPSDYVRASHEFLGDRLGALKLTGKTG
jgi:hypothetical protein